MSILDFPQEDDWKEVQRRAFVTTGKALPETAPSSSWKRAILGARHSPIRYLRYSFYLDVPYWVSVHLCRHVHAQPYVRTQRNDRQSAYDRNQAPQGAPVAMIWDVNAEELMVVANKRLCNQSSPETREIVQTMCRLAEEATPELQGLLVPMCVYHGGICQEMRPCGNQKEDGKE